MLEKNNIPEIRYQGNSEVSVSGALTFETVAALWKKGQAVLPKKENLTFNLEAVSRSDSAGLGLLIEWLSLAKHQKQQFRFTHVPEQLKAIARVSGLEEMLMC
ncbi:MAG: STAS domain-containing protein [Proteobacteria bacterium]|nr:STAS domain-containing protein [Pseudomonadota bacterium]